MAFYASIAPWYDLLFPFDEELGAFINQALDPGPAGTVGVRAGKEAVSRHSFLDVGCGTGTVLSYLTDRFERVVGLDTDTSLLSLAAKKVLPGEGKKVDIIEGDMNLLRSYFPQEAFCFVSCLGNTLAHASGPDSLVGVLGSIRELLETGGVFVFQTINYDRILDNLERGLPTIERGEVSLTRLYSLPKQNGLIDFDTILTDAETETEIRNSVELYPARKNQLQEYLSAVGFKDVRFYGDFKGADWTPYSFLCIGVCG